MKYDIDMKGWEPTKHIIACLLKTREEYVYDSRKNDTIYV